LSQEIFPEEIDSGKLLEKLQRLLAEMYRKLEIPKIVIEELLVNAIAHRDYFIQDSIKIFVFDDRIEIKSPGKLPNGLTVEDIRNGFQRRSRNVIISSMLINILPYKGVGSGILRALKAWPNIEFENNIQSEYFKAIIYRPKVEPRNEQR